MTQYTRGSPEQSEVCSMTSSEEKRLCNFLVFVDEQDDVGQNPDDTEVFVYIVCVDRSDVETITADRKASGFVELPNNVSPTCKLCPDEIVNVEVVGDGRVGDGYPVDGCTLHFLHGSDNHLRFPLCVTGSGCVSLVLRKSKDMSTLCCFCFSAENIVSIGK